MYWYCKLYIVNSKLYTRIITNHGATLILKTQFNLLINNKYFKKQICNGYFNEIAALKAKNANIEHIYYLNQQAIYIANEIGI